MIKPNSSRKRTEIKQFQENITMGSNMFLVALLLLMLISSVTPTDNQNLLAATEEMQRANYFTFVMLVKMSQPDTRLEGNVTFLMPNDRMLANMNLQEGYVSSFLLRHSIPSPLLFGTLEQFPTGTTIPTSLPNCMLRISNNGRRNFALNNVKIISPNLCVAGSSIRCHGIDGVLSEACLSDNNNYSPPPPPSPSSSPCPNSTDPSYKASPPIPSPSLPSAPPSRDNLSPPTLIAPNPTEANIRPEKSMSPNKVSYHGSLNFVTCLVVSLIGFNF